MKTLLCALLFCSLALSTSFGGRSSSSSQDDFAFTSKKKGKKAAYTPPPTPTPPPAPSAALSAFVSTNADKIFGPADMHPPLPKAELAQLRASFSDRFSKASLADRQQFQFAIAVCDGLSQVMTEKAAATSAPVWTQRSAQLKQWIDGLMAQEKAAETSGAAAPAH